MRTAPPGPRYEATEGAIVATDIGSADSSYDAMFLQCSIDNKQGVLIGTWQAGHLSHSWAILHNLWAPSPRPLWDE